MVFLQVLFALGWFAMGVSGPMISCAECNHWDFEDALLIPVCGLFGPFALISVYLSYLKARKRRS